MEVGDERETRPEHIEAAIGPNTAGIHCLAQGDTPRPGTLPLEELLRIGRDHNIPLIMDAAGSVYPTELLSKFVKMGVDLVAYGDTHEEMVAFYQGVLFVNPGSPTRPGTRHERGRLGTLAILDVCDRMATVEIVNLG